LCLNNLTNSSVYVAGCELAYRYCLQPGARYLLLPNYVVDHAHSPPSQPADADTTPQFCIRVFAATDLTCRYCAHYVINGYFMDPETGPQALPTLLLRFFWGVVYSTADEADAYMFYRCFFLFFLFFFVFFPFATKYQTTVLGNG